MKKLLLCLLLLSLAFAACADEWEDASEIFLPDITLTELKNANRVEDLTEEYGTVTVRQRIYASEEVFSETYACSYMSGDTLCYSCTDQDGNIHVFGGGNGCGYDAGLDLLYVAMYLPEAAEEELWVMRETFPLCLSGMERAGKATGGSDGTFSLEVSESIAGQGYLEQEGDLVTQYVFDAETLRVLSYAEYLRDDAGEETLLSETEVEYGAECEMPEILDPLFEKDPATRKVMLVVEHDTEYTKLYTASVPVNAALAVFATAGWQVFEDREYTLSVPLLLPMETTVAYLTYTE